MGRRELNFVFLRGRDFPRIPTSDAPNYEVDRVRDWLNGKTFPRNVRFRSDRWGVDKCWRLVTAANSLDFGLLAENFGQRASGGAVVAVSDLDAADTATTNVTESTLTSVTNDSVI